MYKKKKEIQGRHWIWHMFKTQKLIYNLEKVKFLNHFQAFFMVQNQEINIKVWECKGKLTTI